MIIPNKARALHVTLHKEQPKSGAWFILRKRYYRVEVFDKQTSLDIGRAGGFTPILTILIERVLAKYYLTECYVLLEWS
jgi:hypothetical protein